MKITDYFKNNDYLELKLNDNYYVWLDNATNNICVELCEYNSYDSFNINYLFYDFKDITTDYVKYVVLDNLNDILKYWEQKRKLESML